MQTCPHAFLSNAGIFGRACAALHPDNQANLKSVLGEATALKESLVDKLVSLKTSQQGAGVGENPSDALHCLHISL